MLDCQRVTTNFIKGFVRKNWPNLCPKCSAWQGGSILIGRLGDDQAACGSGGDVFDLSQWTAEKGWVTAWWTNIAIENGHV